MIIRYEYRNCRTHFFPFCPMTFTSTLELLSESNYIAPDCFLYCLCLRLIDEQGRRSKMSAKGIPGQAKSAHGLLLGTLVIKGNQAKHSYTQ